MNIINGTSKEIKEYINMTNQYNTNDNSCLETLSISSQNMLLVTDGDVNNYQVLNIAGQLIRYLYNNTDASIYLVDNHDKICELYLGKEVIINNAVWTSSFYEIYNGTFIEDAEIDTSTTENYIFIYNPSSYFQSNYNEFMEMLSSENYKNNHYVFIETEPDKIPMALLNAKIDTIACFELRDHNLIKLILNNADIPESFTPYGDEVIVKDIVNKIVKYDLNDPQYYEYCECD